ARQARGADRDRVGRVRAVGHPRTPCRFATEGAGGTGSAATWRPPAPSRNQRRWEWRAGGRGRRGQLAGFDERHLQALRDGAGPVSAALAARQRERLDPRVLRAEAVVVGHDTAPGADDALDPLELAVVGARAGPVVRVDAALAVRVGNRMRPVQPAAP